MGEGSGLMPGPLRADKPESGQNCQGEQHIRQREYPFRQVVEEQATDPALHEAGPARTGLAQEIFPHGKRTDHADEGLSRYEEDGGKMRDAEAEVAHPDPAERGAGPDGEQTAHHEQYEQKVDDQDCVGQQRHELTKRQQPNRWPDCSRRTPGFQQE